MKLTLPLPLPLKTPLLLTCTGLLARASSSKHSHSHSHSHAQGNEVIVSITGATGFIGRRLVQRLLADSYKIQILTRSKSKAQRIFPANDYPEIVIVEEPKWKEYIQGSTAVVNLAGSPISTRWSLEIKADIKKSRVSVTSKVVDAINTANVKNRPSVFVSATAVGYYGTSEMKTFDETSSSGYDYLSEVCREWETMAQKVDSSVRLVLLRTGIVLDKDGGALVMLQGWYWSRLGSSLGARGKKGRMLRQGEGVGFRPSPSLFHVY